MIIKLSNLFILSPLEQFEVTSLLSFNAPILGHISLTLTNLALYSLLILFLILGLHYMGNNETKLLPSKWSISLESLFSSINSMVREQIGTSNEIYLPAKRNGNTLWWVKLSNSGDPLKLMVPNCSWKAINGWINHSCTVTSYKINEKQMGNRGSKSDLRTKSVKEQRVDGNWWNKPIHLRCTLTGFERNYQIKIPSKQLKINKLFYSSLNYKPNLNPWFITGLLDAEGSFFTSIFKTKAYKLGWYLKANFAIGLGKNDLSLLLQIKKFFGEIGSISKSKNRNMVIYSVGGIEDLTTIIIPHF